MSFTIHYLGESKTFEKKVTLLDLIKEKDPERQYVAAKVNNRVRELTYEVYYDADVEFLTVKNSEAVKISEATLRYIVAMAFSRCYPNL
jgi:uridine kinase